VLSAVTVVSPSVPVNLVLACGDWRLAGPVAVEVIDRLETATLD